jgi:hypothetical protein
MYCTILCRCYIWLICAQPYWLPLCRVIGCEWVGGKECYGLSGIMALKHSVCTICVTVFLYIISLCDWMSHTLVPGVVCIEAKKNSWILNVQHNIMYSLWWISWGWRNSWLCSIYRICSRNLGTFFFILAAEKSGGDFFIYFFLI